VLKAEENPSAPDQISVYLKFELYFPIYFFLTPRKVGEFSTRDTAVES